MVNPYLEPMTAVFIIIDDLQKELQSATGDQAKAIRDEIEAKTKVTDELHKMSGDWRLGKFDEAVSRLEALANAELAKQARVFARLKRLAENQGISVPDPVVPPVAITPNPVVTPDPISDPTPDLTASPAPVPTGAHREVVIGPQEFDALCRVAKSEVGHFHKYGNDQFVGGLTAVVDTVINRVAHKKFPNSIQAVIDQRFQFSAINTLGSWTKLPSAGPQIENNIIAYLQGRVSGRKGMLGGAINFLNPFISDAGPLAEWGNHVKDNAVAIFGSVPKKDAHYHGFAPGVKLPESYAIHFNGWSPVFDGRGLASGADSDTKLRANLISTLSSELEFFGDGKFKENAKTHYKRVGDYWSALNIPFDGRTKKTLPNGKVTNPAWSAAFISWSVIQQGIGKDQFRGHAGHWNYVNDLIDNKLSNPLYQIMDPADYAPQPGDLLHYGRGSAANYDLAAAKFYLDADSFYPSHSDFVYEVDLISKELSTIGGNVENSVKTKKITIKSDGTLGPRISSGKSYPWIAVLKLRDA